MKLMVQCPEEPESHPHCLHGPTLLFHRDSSKNDGYFTCAAYRDKKHCNFHLSYNKQISRKNLDRRYHTEAQEKAELYIKNRKTVFRSMLNGEQFNYCLECNVLFLHSDLPSHKTHKQLETVCCNTLQDPTQFLPPMDNDKTQAQYFFDTNALKYFVQCIRDLEIKNIICVGAPRLHAYIRTNNIDVKSYLLDIDKRFLNFFDDVEFAWYNMCNNHFFLPTQQRAFERFVKSAPIGRLMIFTDPPFGARTEAIAHTIRQIVRLHNRLHCVPHMTLPIFWIFPYFAAHYIQNEMSELLMCDYKVNYTNHLAYTNVGKHSRKLGSPVRIFTNVSLSTLKLPEIEKDAYRYCHKCQRFVSLENLHCDKCVCCPSKNGDTYRHCTLCGICVKSYYKHCNNCRRCVQLSDHNCQMYQEKQICRICLRRGHIETKCIKWWQLHQQPNHSKLKCCSLCRKSDHNELKCAKRTKFIKEYTFLGQTIVHEIK